MRHATVLICLAAVVGCQQPNEDLRIERFDTSLNVLADGSIEVEERHLVKAGAARVSSFRRQAPVWRHDGAFAVDGAMEGMTVAPGPELDVTWNFSPSDNSTHLFLVRYRVANAVEVSGIRGTVAWRLLDEGHQYGGALVCVTLTFPAGTVLLENPGFDETVARPGVEFGADPAASCAVASSQASLTRRATVTIDTLAVGEPMWQYNARRARDLMPAFLTTGLSLVAVGIGIVALVRFRYPTLSPRPDPDAAPLAPKVELALARDRPDALDLDKLTNAGLVEAERMNAARDLRRAGIVTLAFGAAAWTYCATQLDHFGRWPLAIPIAILFCGALFVVSAPRLSLLSQAGVNARARVLYSARVRDGQTSV